MKQKDIILIIVVVFISGVISIFGSKFFISTPKNRKQTVEVVTPITDDFPIPSNQYFNENSVDPTTNVTIGNSTNTQPFSGN